MSQRQNSPWLQEQSWQQVETYLQTSDTILLPVGATEQHGHHLPLFVDTGWASHIAEQVARRCGLLVAPPQHVAYSAHHMAYPGTLSLRPQTLIALIEDICHSLIEHGFRKIVIVNGNRLANLPPIDIAAAEVRHRTGIYCAVVDVGLIAKREVFEICGHGLGHAADCETSFMLYAYPYLVDMDAANWQPSENKVNEQKYSVPHPIIEAPFDRDSAFVWPTAQEFRQATEAQHGVGGDPRVANADKGKKIVASIVQNFVQFIETEVASAKVDYKPRGARS